MEWLQGNWPVLLVPLAIIVSAWLAWLRPTLHGASKERRVLEDRVLVLETEFASHQDRTHGRLKAIEDQLRELNAYLRNGKEKS